MHHHYLQRTRGLSLLALGLSAVLACTSVAAAAAEWYLGAGAGSVRLQDADTALVGTGFDDKDSGAKLFAGYSFNRHVGAELSYLDLGEFTGSFNGVTTQRTEVTAYDLALVGSLPVRAGLSLLGKVGAARWNVDARTAADVSRSGTGLSVGVGAQYDFNARFGVRVEWERLADVGDRDATGQSDFRFVSASALYRF